MRVKQRLVLCMALCVLLSLTPPMARAQDALSALGVWEAFPEDDTYRRMAYDSFFHDRQRDIVLAILYGQAPGEQVLCQLEIGMAAGATPTLRTSPAPRARRAPCA